MRLRRQLLNALATTASTLLVATPPKLPAVTLNPEQTNPGASVTFSGVNFEAGKPVDVTVSPALTYSPSNPVTDSSGSFGVTLAVPRLGAASSYRVCASGAGVSDPLCRVLTVVLPTPSPSPSPTPQGFIQPSAASAPATTRLDVTGTGFPPGQHFQLTIGSQVVKMVDIDAAGGFNVSFPVPDLSPGPYSLCVVEPAGNQCVTFTVTAAPSPTPVATATPSAPPTPTSTPSQTASTTGANPRGGASPLAFVTRPPFALFPGLLLLGLIGLFAYRLWAMRPAPALDEVLVTHKAPPPRSGPSPVDLAGAGQSPAPAASPPSSDLPPTTVVPYEWVEPPQPTAYRPPLDAPGPLDSPPDLPQASD
jgi:hypothetical protein